LSTWDERTLVEDLLARGVDDWVSAAEVFDVASRSAVSDPFALRALSVGLIAEVLVRGWMVAGDVTGSGFNRWDCTTAEAIMKVSDAWFAREQPLVMPGEVVWLNTTEQGAALGSGVLQREQA
jgi:hypothetical protein